VNLYSFVNDYLTGAGRPRVVTAFTLYRLLDSAFGVSHRNTNMRRIKDLVESNILKGVTRGVYINMVAVPAVEPQEAVSHVRSGAVVSLYSVLGEYGVLNNHTEHVTAILPTGVGDTHFPRLPSLRTGAGVYTFYGMAANKLQAGDYEDRLIATRFYPCATPERAFLDHLYLGSNHRSRLTMPPLDSDIGDLDQARLWRLAAAMEIEEPLEEWVKKKETYDQDEDVQNNMSLRLGF